MTLCDDGHDEVCYEGPNCPCCEAIKETKASDELISLRDDEIVELQAKLENLKP